VLTGKALINGIGNSAANTITGNDAVNQLDRRRRRRTRCKAARATTSTTLTGGDDTVNEAAGQGIDTVKSSDNVDLTSVQSRRGGDREHRPADRCYLGQGQGFNNAILGNDGANVLDGGAGNDR